MMFESNKEAFKFLNKLGYFICKFPRGSMKLPMVCKKTDKDNFVEIQGVDSFTDKINMNIILVDDTPILNTIKLSVFSEYDEIEAENKEAQKLKKAIQKDSKPIMNVRNAVLARGYGQDFYVIDVDNAEALPIDKSLIEIADVKYNKQTAINAIKNENVNRMKGKFDHESKIWKEIGK